MGIIKQALKASAKKTDDILETVASGKTGRTALDDARPRRPYVDRTPEASRQAAPEVQPDLEGMTPESVATTGATIGPLPGDTPNVPAQAADDLTPPPATPEEAGDALAATFKTGEEYQPRTLNRNVNFDYVESPEGFKSLIDTVAEGNAGFRAARRGTRSHEQTKEAAANIDPDVTLERLMRRKPGQIWNAEQSLAARQTLIDSADVVYTMARDLTENITGTREMRADVTAEQLFEFRQAVANMRAVQAAVQGNASEVGRALNQFRIPVGVAGLAQMADAMNKHGGRAVAENLVKLANLTGGDIGQLSRIAEMTTFAKAMEMLHYARINLMLSGLVTHAKNTGGNAMYKTWDLLVSATAGNVVRPVKNLLGVDQMNGPGVRPEEFLVDFLAGTNSALDALRLGGRAYAKFGQGVIGETGKAEVREIVTPTMLLGGADTTIGKAADTVWTRVLPALGTNLLGAADEFQKVINYRGALAKFALRDSMAARPGDADYDFIAKMLGVKGETDADLKLVRSTLYQDMANNPSGELHARAIEEARRLTFTDEARGLGKQLQSLRDTTIGGKIVLPFMQTPARLAQNAVQISPLGTIGATIDQLYLGKFKTEMREMIATGGAKSDEAIARLTLGNTLWAWIIMQAFDDDEAMPFTGQGGMNRDSNAAMGLMGARRSSFRIERGDEPAMYIDYRSIPVLAENFAGAATLAEYLRYTDDPDVFTAIWYAGMLGMAQNVTTKNYLQGAADVIEILNAPRSQSDAAFKKFVTNTFASYVVPNILRQTNPDRIKRDRRHAVDFWDGLKKEVVSRVPAYLPGVETDSTTIPPSIDYFGNVQSYDSLGWYFVSPYYRAFENKDPVYMEARNNNLMPNEPSRFLRVPGLPPVDLYAMPKEGKDRPGWVYADYAALVGAARYERVQAIIDTKEYKAAMRSTDQPTDGAGNMTKRQYLRKAYAEGLDIGTQQLAAKYPELEAIIKAQQKELEAAATNPPPVEEKRDWTTLDF